jgi:hypothetical protein
MKQTFAFSLEHRFRSGIIPSVVPILGALRDILLTDYPAIAG